MLTLQNAFDAIDHALMSQGAGGDDIERSRLEAANSSGAILYSYPWKWRDAGLWSADIVAGQDYVDLPPETGQVSDVTPTDLTNLLIKYVEDLGLVERERAWPLGTAYALLAPYDTIVNGESVTRLLWSRTPTDSVVGGLRVRGKRKWARITNISTPTATVIPLPREMPIFETLFLDFCRAYARGYEEAGGGQRSMESELSAVLSGPTFMLARDEDQRRFSNLGQMKNTAIDVARRLRNVGTRRDAIYVSPPDIDLS
jgi:hypothetical protein